MKVFLAGKIPKGEELKSYKDWRQEYKEILLKNFPDMEFLDPDNTKANHVTSEADSLFWFGHGAWMAKESDVIIIQADRKIGMGTGQEMLIAKYFNKPVITILPKDTHHRRTNLTMRSGFVPDWIHPFVNSTSDIIVETLEDAVTWLKEYEANKSSKEIKTINLLDDSIAYYLKVVSEAGA